MLDADILTAIATAPIPGPNPCGESLRYEEAWGQLEAEIGKLENPGGGEVDWRAVEQGAVALLTAKGKDVLLTAWLVRALWQRDGMPGLAAGLETTQRLFATFWDGLNPQRVRARRAALEWLGEKLAPLLPEDQVRGHPEETARCQAAIAAINAVAAERFEGEDSGLVGLGIRLRELSDSGTPPAAAGAGAEAAPAEEAAAPAAGKAVPAGPIANRAHAIVRLKELGEWFAKHEPHSPIVPLLRRAEAWSRLDFQAVFNELLKNRQDARDHLWDVLGIVETPPQG